MLDQETQDAIKILAANLQAPSDRRAPAPIFDFAMKLSVALSAAAIIATVTMFFSMQSTVSQLSWQYEQVMQQLKDLKDFTKAPRFTKEDYYIEMRVYERRMEMVEKELAYRKDFVTETEKRISKLEQYHAKGGN